MFTGSKEVAEASTAKDSGQAADAAVRGPIRLRRQ